MGRASGLRARDPFSGVILDLIEDLQGIENTGIGTTPGTFNLSRTVANATLQQHQRIFTVTDTDVTHLANTPEGIDRIRWTMGITSAIQSTTGLVVPMEQQFSDPNAPPIITRRPFKEYEFRVPVIFPAGAGAGIVEIGIGISTQGITFSGLRPGAMWLCDPAGSGLFHPARRVVEAGAILNGPDFFGRVNTWHEYGIRYTEGQIPRLTWLLDSDPVFSVTGDANMPNNTSGGTMGPFIGIGIGAGTTMDRTRARFTVRLA